MKYLIVFSFLVLVALYSCEYNHYEQMLNEHIQANGPIPCDSTGVISYTQDIAPIMVAQCGANNSCHNATGAGGGIVLEDYNGVSYAGYTGQLWSCVVWDGQTSNMPKDASVKLDTCSLYKIKKWLDAGMQNN